MDKDYQYQLGTLYSYMCQMAISWSDLSLKVSKKKKKTNFGMFISCIIGNRGFSNIWRTSFNVCVSFRYIYRCRVSVNGIIRPRVCFCISGTKI